MCLQVLRNINSPCGDVLLWGRGEPKSLVTVNKDDQVVMEEENSKYMYFTPQLSVINMLHD